MKYKEKFQSDAALKTAINDKWGDTTTRVETAVAPLREQLNVYASKSAGLGLLAVIGFILLKVGVFAGVFLVPGLIIGVVVFWYLAKALYGLLTTYNEMSLLIDQIMFPQVLKTLGLPLAQNSIDHEPNDEAMRVRLAASELVTEPHNTFDFDDAISTSVYDREAFFVEGDIKHVTGSGKNRQVKHIFKGVFAVVALPRSLVGKTFISTEGDKSGFGHISFWNGIMDTGARETELEWNDFENKLHVAATDPTEARYILTPDFMQDLYTWWLEKPGNIRVSFIGNHLGVLYPDKHVRINHALWRIDTLSLRDYALSIARPLVHILHLVEDVEKRFRS